MANKKQSITWNTHIQEGLDLLLEIARAKKTKPHDKIEAIRGLVVAEQMKITLGEVKSIGESIVNVAGEHTNHNDKLLKQLKKLNRPAWEEAEEADLADEEA